MDFETLPKHIAVIMDGNGRWAKQRGLERSEGHRAGTRTALDVVTACRRRSIRHLTLYTFSKENWSRPEKEVSFLFELLKDFITRELPTLLENSIRLKVLGELSDIPWAARQVLKHAMKKTRDCGEMILNLALNYSGRDEITRAIKAMLADKLDPESIDEETIKDYLYTAGQPDPDLVIRTSGELRLSNYLLYQSAYSELYFTDTLWPDFNEQELDKALQNYAGRQRRFGKTGEQAG